jgi:D-alanyl-lipoteichoic acid acyltransferase DltB (MBOAT superfamily)
MLFHSLEFAIFFVIVFVVYWFVVNNNLRKQNLFLLIASCIFYGWWDWKFLSLIFVSIIVDYVVGIKIHETEEKQQRKYWLWVSLAVNLGMLGFFKYYNFFVGSFVDAFSTIGVNLQARTLNIILPVGISFYTFQTLSYTIDIYRKRLKPTRDFINFAAFVSFFPQLVAGPIERAAKLLPQIEKPRQFDYAQAKDGLRQMLWGFFKKIAIADVCGQYADYIFQNSENLHSLVLLAGALLFLFQIYGDFSGYSDIAIGTAKIFGIRLMINFAYPLFVRDFVEFWQKWHISMIRWFVDYLGLALGGSGGKIWRRYLNFMVIFTVSGLWHGPTWSFVFFGFIHGVLMAISYWRRRTYKIRYGRIVAEGKMLPSLKLTLQFVFLNVLGALTAVFFRVQHLGDAFRYIGRVFWNPEGMWMPIGWDIPLLLSILFVLEWGNRHKEHPLQFERFGKGMRLATYFGLVYLCVIYFDTNYSSFIYFQF